MQDNQIDVSCKQLTYLHCVCVCVCVCARVLHLTFSLSRCLELSHIKHHCLCFTLIYMFSLNLGASMGGGQCRDCYAPFQTRKLKVQRQRRRPQCSISFSGTCSTSPGCLSCIPWNFVKGTKRSSLVNPAKKMSSEIHV